LKATEELKVNGEVNVQISIVNVAKEPCMLVRIDNLIPSGFEVSGAPSHGVVENDSLNLQGRLLGSLRMESIQLRFKANKVGVAKLNPQIIFVNRSGGSKTAKTRGVTIVVHPQLSFKFSTEAAEKVFDFLVRSFVQDYMQLRMTLEHSGWRTAMQIVKHCKISKWNMYEGEGQKGSARAELKKRGFVESRIFHGERGRGGKIRKMRVAYDRETIKKYIDEHIANPPEK
jgi:hypothetical protein